MSFVERYHGPLRWSFKIIEAESPDLANDEIVQLAVKSINDSAGPGGLGPARPVYTDLFRLGLPTDNPTPNITKCVSAPQKATQKMTKHFARRQVSAAAKPHNGPDKTDLCNAPINTPVLVIALR